MSSSDVTGDYEQLKELYRQYKAQSSVCRPKRKKRYVPCEREEVNRWLVEDYFAENPRWGDSVFRRHFRMRRPLFLRIVNTLEAREPYFQQRPDVLERQGISPLVKCTVALRQLANGGSADHYDEYLHVTETTGIECLKKFYRAIIEAFGDEYLRKLNSEDCRRLLQLHEEKHGFPSMLGNIDCMHWAWKKFPTAWAGAYTRGDKGHPTFMLEAVASQNLRIWHAFFGVAGSNNDVNMLNQSPIFNDFLKGKAPHVVFTANGRTYNMGYYLGDEASTSTSTDNTPLGVQHEICQYLVRSASLHDKGKHQLLQTDLTEEIWARFGRD